VTEEQRSQLLKLAAEMVRCEGMPPYFAGDWDLPKTTPVTARRKISEKSQISHAQCKNWSRVIVSILDADRKKQAAG